MKEIELLSNLADIFGILYFSVLSNYMINKKNKTDLEKLITFFGISGLICDFAFTSNFLFINNEFIFKLSKIADVSAIHFFSITSYYFHKKSKRTKTEIFLYLFSLIGVVVDSIFTFNYILE